MASLFDTRRYLTNFDSAKTAHLFTDVLVIGTGLAGARAAIEAANYGTVTVVTKDTFEHSATQLAQGGIAAAIGPGDSPRAHLEDTIRVGCGLNRRDAVERLVQEAPQRIEELVRWGIKPDRTGDRVALGREGGHSQNRIVHVRGDQTGRELVAALKQRVRQTEGVRVFEHCFLIDLLTQDGTCLGAVTYHKRHGHQLIQARQTILAGGGCGQIWRETTNPTVATGDGLAVAFRAGAHLCDLEMMQFHPTTLYVAGSGRALISEAVRGEGAYLVDHEGQRFMAAYHPDAELAPRDVVSRAINTHIDKTQSHCVFLDVRHIAAFKERFPQIARHCADFQIDVTRDLIPVRPSAHYMIGGIDVSPDGSTTIDGLLACGEVACTGVHGANRLASNSLLEGLVFGRIAGQVAGERAAGSEHAAPGARIISQISPSQRTELDLADIKNSLRSLMWRNVGIVRFEDRLAETRDIINFWGHYTLDKTFDEPGGWEMQNQLTVARLMAMCALERRDSVGVHYRGDAPDERATPPYYTAVTRDPEGTKPIRRSLETS
jgi:L-aspartate oxidase